MLADVRIDQLANLRLAAVTDFVIIWFTWDELSCLQNILDTSNSQQIVNIDEMCPVKHCHFR